MIPFKAKRVCLMTGFVLCCIAKFLTWTASASPTNAPSPLLTPTVSEISITESDPTNAPPLLSSPEATEIGSKGDPTDIQDTLLRPLTEMRLDNASSSRSWWSTSDGAEGQRLWSQTKLLFGVGLVTSGVLYAMPESVTNWDQDQGIEDLPDRWWKNVSRRPVWDKDDWFINYVGHTYCGGVYYQMARKSGYNQWDSFVYTSLMSTFFWEYGIEAFAERPSIQDLVVTPVGGWLYGEWAYRCEQRIEENDERVFGSKTIGSISLFFLDPIDHLGKGVNKLFGREWVVTGRVTFTPQAYADQTDYAIARNSAIRPGFRMALERPF